MVKHSKVQARAAEQGFTLIEILVAIALLGILAAVLTATLTGSLSLNRQAQRQLDTTSNVQQVMENVRNAWTVLSNYNNACAPGMTVPSGYTVKFINLSTRAEPINQNNTIASPPTAAPVNTLNTTTSSTCTASTNATLTGGAVPTMRRVIVQSGTAGPGNSQVIGPQDVALTLDLLRP
ncbi:type II secretion system protein [Deinococcus metallilatus]|uniref:Prepilin-type N-terminal cleavage/methylation domain-containing protein n=1 Tax=Deinococcus metallilatus TaxID=1211322 RepID=A0AAJ5F6Q0_9DEIO|nr:type II secretion system protein [Deinococcus metallilatus]MBB5294725.1 prepilin-type N-terminal cleavage/methylation domain-containing protein [Deinococcus metallilatus]QBY07752.1 type II secretion system protein [Deinococcus metallilatus]RXJ14168.1 type II secretion system protein [Deinococcus metallilatus]TLK30133.1 type II secretion system protein [Deinococcus metallilatus]GMA15942.1 pili assembly chaperone [Deinococcus metallilatus]